MLRRVRRYADASLEKASWPEVMKGLAWCRDQLQQVGEGRWDALRVLDVGSCNNALAKELRDMTLGGSFC